MTGTTQALNWFEDTLRRKASRLRTHQEKAKADAGHRPDPFSEFRRIAAGDHRERKEATLAMADAIAAELAERKAMR